MSVIPYSHHSAGHQHPVHQIRLDGQTVSSSLLINLLTWTLAALVCGLGQWLSGDYRISLSLLAATLVSAPFFWAWVQLRQRQPVRSRR